MSKERESLSLPVNSVVGRYQLRHVDSCWGFYLTYLAEVNGTGRRVLVHELLPEELVERADDGSLQGRSGGDKESFAFARERFVREGRALAACPHPGIQKFLDVIEANNTAYWVTSMDEPRTLKGWQEQLGRPPTEEELRTLLRPLLAALQQLHAARLHHFNLKLDSIQVAPDGAPVLVHFAGARQDIARHSHGSGAVTPGYSPIEQYDDDKPEGPWTDIYSLAAVLHRLVTGQLPPEATARLTSDPYQKLAARFAGKYSAEFLSAIDAALAVDPTARPQSIAGWRKMVGIPSGDTSGRRSHPALVPVCAAISLVVIAVGGWYLFRPKPIPPIIKKDIVDNNKEDQKKKDADQKKAEEAQKKLEEEKKAEEAKAAKEKRKAEEQKLAEAEKKAEEEKKAAEKAAEDKAAAAKQADEAAKEKQKADKAAEEKAENESGEAAQAASKVDEAKGAAKKRAAEKAAAVAAEKAAEARREADKAAAESAAANVAAKQAELDKASAERTAAEKDLAQKSIEQQIAAVAADPKSAEAKAAADQAAAAKAAAAKTVTEKTAAEKEAADKLAAAVAAQQFLGAKKVSGDNPPAEKSPAEKAAEEKAAAEKAAAEKAAAEKAAAEKAAAGKRAAEKAAAEKAAAEKAAADKAAAEKAASDKAEAEMAAKKAAEEKAAADKANADKAAEDKKQQDNSSQNKGGPPPPPGPSGGQVGSGLGGIWETNQKDASGKPLKRLIIYPDTHFELTTESGKMTGLIRAKLGIISLEPDNSKDALASSFVYKSMSVIETDGVLGKLEWTRISATTPERETQKEK